MSERLPWQKFYKAAKMAGYHVELPDSKERADFRTKMTDYLGLDPRRNQIRPVLISGKGEKRGGEFFTTWYENGPEADAQKQEIVAMIRAAAEGAQHLSLGFTHHRGRSITERIADRMDSGRQYDVDPYSEDRLIISFLEKETKESRT